MKMTWRRAWLTVILSGCTACAVAQVAVSVPVALLPASFGSWKTASAPAVAPVSSLSLVTANKDALEECQPQRSQVGDYSNGTRSLHVEAIEFIDRTGATSAYTLIKRKDMTPLKGLGSMAAAGDGAVLFTVGDSIAVAYPATTADVVALKPLAEAMPKVFGNKGVAPLLPALLPPTGLVEGSVRYALGGASYAAEGGVLPAAVLGWDKEAEGVTADYHDPRGDETLTMLLYPTPALAGNFARVVQGQISAAGAQMANARVRREGDIVVLAEGSFDADQAQKLVENVHHKQIVSMDQDIQPSSHQQVVQVYGLLTNIAVLAGVLMLAAVLLGLFLGGGRAMLRILQGKPAASEPEFLSLHLDPMNKAVYFEKDAR
jgi:drug/metabolite transporter superfamily protein YnfA